MAYENDQNEFPLPANGDSNRRSEKHLPRYFRTQVNSKFLSSTFDQLIQPGVAEKINSYIGREVAKAYQQDDTYLTDVSIDRKNYQLEPASVITDELGNVEFYKDYNDYINQIKNFNGNTVDHSRLNEQEYYAWNPHIDWDKFTNFREYYWLPNGPQTVNIVGQNTDIVSTYTVRLSDNLDNYGYVFTPDGLTQNPTLKLYRGVKYRFDINTPGLPITFKTKRTLDEDFLIDEGISIQSVENGVIEIEFSSEVPNNIYYVAENDINASGLIKVANIEEASFIDVESEIIGKKTYTSSTGVALSNGMKIKFQGEVVPAIYQNTEWYVEGVGDKIQLINESSLNVASVFASTLPIEFDTEGFDRSPFDEAIGFPAAKDYFVINRASKDGNLWSRYNRWFHRSVIEKSAEINNQQISIDQSQRAKRPIIEFDAGLKLANFGTFAKTDVDLVDNFTIDIFSTIEGSAGYNIDGVDITDGMRILFTADTDILVRNRIFEVQFITFASGSIDNRQITLVDVTDTHPVENETVLVRQGNTFGGTILHYNDNKWILSQSKVSVNQAPLFDVFDENGNSYLDSSFYQASTFTGTKVFSYKQGVGPVDSELGIPLSYRTIENVGDITFSFDLLQDSFSYQIENESFTKGTNIGFVRTYSNIDNFDTKSAWIKAEDLSSQPVIRQYVFDNTFTSFDIDVYDNSAEINDLWIKVYVNNELKFQDIDYTIQTTPNNNSTISFTNDLNIGDIIVIKTKSSAPKNNNGYYEIASNLEKNPLNNDLNEFTLGEVNDHVSSIVEETDSFNGLFPGVSNLRDAGPISKYGKKFIKHSSPLNLALYHMVDKEANIVKSLRYARREYGKFKRLFLQTANELGYDGPVKEHVDRILQEIVKDKTDSMPFYFSDMIPLGASKRITIEIEDADSQNFFGLSEIFDLSIPSRKAVQVYLNGVQLTHQKDYTFNSDGFVVLTASKQIGDIVDIYEYETTNGSYVPPTPTKLGLYPKYEPVLYNDNTYLESTNVIQGHDGSIIIAYNDFRDELLLELERRIYNNIKIDYDVNYIDIHEFRNGEYRNSGFNNTEINNAILADFVQWTQLIEEDYAENNSFERSNSFTWNYSSMTDSQGQSLPGFWRAVYKHAYDTDRPHTHPWEMLGFSIKPTWWDSQYGPAPYTSDNLLLWEDLEKGVIRNPGQRFLLDKKYQRPGLTSHLPVDNQGNLLSPAASGYAKNYITTNIDNSFEFGDESPVETAWRRSSEYPFAFITAWALTQPSKLFGAGFDRFRQVRNIAGELIYTPTQTHIRLEDLIFPNTENESEQRFTSGLVNYIAGYMTANITTPFENYQDKIKKIGNQIGFKLGGFTDKSKFNLILDSRTPLNQGNVFVPEENYKVFLNTSTPIDTINYSGVIIEKQPGGYVVRGYDQEQPVFKVYPTIALENDPVITVGGISESFVTWDSNKTYTIGQNVEYEGSYYRVAEQHTSSPSFDIDKFSKLPSLPLIGGRSAVFRRKFFENKVSEIPYGTLFRTVQDVVDFLLGYERYLETSGFIFDYFDEEDETVNDWKKSAKEFMFWTTQNWAAGSVISLSPGAKQIKLVSEYSTVDNIFDSFYGYTLYKADGKKLVEEFSSLSRQNPNEFILKPKNTADGIYAIKLPLVQKEHVVLLDNRTVFGDIIYDLEPGYRQERIRALGYRTADWDGSLNIPGFIYDDAPVTEWEPWKDYAIGDLVKHKEFYYAADNKIAGKESFDSSEWNRLPKEPAPVLLTNFDYKINQFADFYDLDSDNFDIEQQRFAQHLIGYQNRNYLANIINDDVSQYKFYQGFIQDKGTKNSLTKLFDVLGNTNKDSLEFYEEWAIKSGQYGAADGFDEVEFLLDEEKFRLTPQPIELVQTVSGEETDLIYRIRPFEVYQKPENYNHAPFPTVYINDGYTKNSGYVNPEDVQHVVSDYDAILNINFKDCKNNDYVWVGNEKLSWNVYKHSRTNLNIESLIQGESEFTIVLDSTPRDIQVGEILGVYDLITTEITPEDSTYQSITQTTAAIGNFYKVKDVIVNKIILETNEPIDDIEKCKGKISRFISARKADLSTANSYAESGLENNDIIWIDDAGNNQWTVLQKNSGFNELETISNHEGDSTDHDYAQTVSANNSNTVIAVGAPNNQNGKVYIYYRGSNSSNWKLTQTLEPSEVADPGQRYGESVSISPDGKYLVVGSPDASNVKTNYKQNYVTTNDYAAGDIVKFQEVLWQAVVDVEGAESNIQFGSFDGVAQSIERLNIGTSSSQKVNTILTGNYPFTNQTTDHLIIRAPEDMYEGSAIGDQIKLKWNLLTFANQDQTEIEARQPFDNEIAGINGAFLTDKHEIRFKIDAILYIDASTNVPNIGDRVEVENAFGTVEYTYLEGARLTIYLKDVNGQFPVADSLFTSEGDFVGEYERAAPAETIDTSDVYGGFWAITVPDYNVNTNTEDEGRGLVYVDFIPNNQADTNRFYYNILDFETSTINSENTINSYIQALSYQSPAGGAGGSTDAFLSDLFVVRAPKVLTDNLNIVSEGNQNNDEIDLHMPLLPRFYVDLSQPLDNNVEYFVILNGVRIDDPFFGTTLQTNPNAETSTIIGDGATTRIFFDDLGIEFAPTDLLQIQRSGTLVNVVSVNPFGTVLQDINLSYASFNRRHTIYDLWDGYINFDFTVFNPATGEPFEPRVGDTVVDVTTDAEAVVTFYQRNGSNVTIFVKAVTGNWSLGNQFGDNAEIKYLGTPGDPDPAYRNDQVMGQTQFTSLGFDSAGIGKLIVLSNVENIPVSNQSVIIDNEYWLYREGNVLGIPRSASIPSLDNNDWQRTFNIPATSTGTVSGLVKEGLYSVYIAEGSGRFSLVNDFSVPEKQNNFRLGAKVKLREFNDLYRLFVQATGDQNLTGNDEDFTSWGRIYFVNQGIDNFSNRWNWDFARNKRFIGQFVTSVSYVENDIVFHNGELYVATTNIAPGSFNANDWRLIPDEDRTEFVGYIPNDTDLVLGEDSSSILSATEDLLVFAKDFDTSENGEVLVVSNNNRTSAPNEVLIYRSFNGNYLKSQVIEAPNNFVGFGDVVSISSDGTVIAIGLPFDDTSKLDQGQVNIYQQVDGSFVQTQTLNSPNNESAEMFGRYLDFDNNTLIVTGKNADSSEITTFDTNTTIFDNGFTKYKNYDNDSGVVYVYERINNTLVYAQTLSYNDNAVDYFGRNITIKNNHIYVGLPRYQSELGRQGSLVDYSRNQNITVLEQIRNPKFTVNLEKIKKVILYDTKENELLTYLDYIDPIQGKIAGPAEQEISFKTYLDPATYTIGTIDLNVNNTNSWGPEQVGRVWWDLTNAKFINPYQGNVIFSANNWNTLFDSNTIDIYEWVESNILPNEWDEISDTEEGISRGISGKSRYGNLVYVQKQVYDEVAQSFSNKFYFWVKGKTTVPNVEWRTISIDNVAKLISDPASQGYRHVNFINENSFVLHNCDNFIKNKDVSLSVQYWTIDDQENNIHNQYQIVTEGLATSIPKRDIERKWFDSLIGYDEQFRNVPDPNLSIKQKYGILNRPRQSWFVNRFEALKQVIERVNTVLLQNLIIDDKDISPLLESDPPPSSLTNLYDTTVDTVADLDFVGVARAQRAVLTPVIENGKVTRVIIENAGRGYLVPPTVTIAGQGSDAVIETTIDSLGKIDSITILNQGFNYDSNTVLSVRRFTALVTNDETIQGKWALYERNSDTREWLRIESQSYSVPLYWEYADWYAKGLSEFTNIDYLIEESFQLQSLEDNIGDIVKISNIGTGGWLLLEKIDNQNTPDYTVNYKTVGRQNGTIQFKDSLFDNKVSLVGFDSISYDTKFFDAQPTIETRKILNAIKNNLLIDELSIEYNALFFASIRYVFAEQGYVDWAFKTSFVKAKHNVGDLREDITFNNDNLPSYEQYLNEVKPYKTKLREYLSSYEKIDNTQSVTTDFDLSPTYNEDLKQILPQIVRVENNNIIGTNADFETYPNRHWLENVGYEVTSIEIADGGSGYTFPPVITLEGGGGSGAEARALLGNNGVITSVVVTNSGQGYISAPSVQIEGTQTEDGTPARLSVVIGNGLVRSMHTALKFDRVSGIFQITKLAETETFTGSGSQYIFQLTWPMDLRNTTIEVVVDGNLALSSEYRYYNKKDTSKGYDRNFGTIEFTNPPRSDANISISYRKSIDLLSAQDRINLFYDPATGQYGKDLSQLMDGIDYGGVEVKSFEFSGISGWDTDDWYNGIWDTYDTTFDDEIFELDGSTLALDLAQPLALGVTYNIYKNNVRIDDPLFGTGNETNPNAQIPSFVGDGQVQTINLGDYDISANAGDIFVVRKIDSDGSFLPSPDTYDTIVQGGNLAYSTATGLNAEDINIDGDGFVTPTTSKGPEEIVPGQLLDTVDIQVYEQPTQGSSLITMRNYIGNGNNKTFNLGTMPLTEESLFVKVDYSIISKNDYVIDYDNNTVTFDTAPANDTRITILILGTSGNRVLDIDSFIGDGSTNDFLTNVRWREDINYFATANGKSLPSILVESDDAFEVSGNVVIRFAEPPAEDAEINFAIFEGDQQSYSTVVIDEFEADGSTTAFDLSQPLFGSSPGNFYTIVKVNDKVLNAGYNEIFEVSSLREYQLKLYQIPTGTVNAGEVEVYLNNEKLNFLQDWSFEGAGAFDPSVSLDTQAGSTIILSENIGLIGDKLRVFIISNGEYRFGYFEDSTTDDYESFVSTPGTLHLDDPYNHGDNITVYQFSNDIPQGIDRQNYDIIERTPLTFQSEDYYELRQLRTGLIPLRSETLDAQYVWVVKNGSLLNPSVDYDVTENRRYVKLVDQLNENDVIETIHFANVQLKNKFGWRQFKDMLNRTAYYRIDNTTENILTKELRWYDRTIILDRADNLPNPTSTLPGVVFINGERIEYFVKDGNELKQLRRGTLGTGVPEVHQVGSDVQDQSRNTIMPYRDETVTLIFDGDETTNTFELDFIPLRVDEFEVFVAGRRLRKNMIDSYQFEYTQNGEVVSAIAQDSPEGDVVLPPEYTVENNILTLLESPGVNQKVMVVRKIGKLWTDPGTPLSDADTDIGRFLRAKTVELPR